MVVLQKFAQKALDMKKKDKESSLIEVRWNFHKLVQRDFALDLLNFLKFHLASKF